MSTLKDLNKHLFDQLDRLAKADKSELETEAKRAQTISQVSENIIDAHKTQLEAVKLIAEYKGLNTNQEIPKGMVVSFRNGIRTDCRIENLILLTRAELARLNQSYIKYSTPDTHETCILLAKIKDKATPK